MNVKLHVIRVMDNKEIDTALMIITIIEQIRNHREPNKASYAYHNCPYNIPFRDSYFTHSRSQKIES